MNNATKVCDVCKEERHSSYYYSFLKDTVCFKCMPSNPTCNDKSCCVKNTKSYNRCNAKTRRNACKKVINKPKDDDDEDIEYPQDNKNEEQDSDFEP
jgi:hypothetical protein